MPVFISHSVSPWELASVNAVADVAVRGGLPPLIPYQDSDAAAHLPGPIAAQIESSDCIVAIATQGDNICLSWLIMELWSIRISVHLH